MPPEERRKRNRKFTVSPAEVMTLLILFHRSGYRDFKHFYNDYVPFVLNRKFPERVGYNRFIELAQSVLIPVRAYLNTRRVTSKGTASVDSTPLRVCHDKRIPRHKGFKETAERGKSSTGRFYGFRPHLVIDDEGGLVAFFVTPGNIDDRKGLKKTAEYIKGKLFGDKGYISKALREQLRESGIQLITDARRNMKKAVPEGMDKILLRKRSLIETVNDQLKNISRIEHSRHRSVAGFTVNPVCASVAYTRRPEKPSLNIRKNNIKDPVVVDENNTARSMGGVV